MRIGVLVRWALIALIVIPLMSACGGGRTVDIDRAPPNLPELPDYEVEVCGWADDPVAVECFFGALGERRGAELFSRNVTVEGDPIYQIARATPEGDIEMYTDFSADSFGGGGEKLRRSTCEAEGVEIVGPGLFSVGRCGPYSFGW